MQVSLKNFPFNWFKGKQSVTKQEFIDTVKSKFNERIVNLEISVVYAPENWCMFTMCNPAIIEKNSTVFVCEFTLKINGIDIPTKSKYQAKFPTKYLEDFCSIASKTDPCPRKENLLLDELLIYSSSPNN